MENFIELVIVFGLGWYLGSRVATYVQTQIFKQILIDLKVDNRDLIRVARKDAPEFMQEQLDQIESHVNAAEDAALEHIEIKVEKHSNTLYAFRKDNDQFLGQGSTKDELITAMSQRLKNVRLTVVEGNEHMKSEA
jgi:PDZ domain-containing secreted protein